MKKNIIFIMMSLFVSTFAFGQALEKATFSGGCFWCMEPPFEKIEGVQSVISGFTGGDKKNPSYKNVASGETKHIESVQITYDPSKVTYEQLLEVFWRQIDPTDDGGQFVDRGHQYTTAIFYHNEKQKAQAEESKKALGESRRFKKSIVTVIRAAKEFYAAEDYHQDYYKVNPLRYKFYRYNSGRDKYLKKVWGKELKPIPPKTKEGAKYKRPTDKEIKKMLSEQEYYVTQKEGTESPFKNKYWDNKRPGIYVDVVTGEPLFSSLHKFKSGTGWPSFYQALVPGHIVEKKEDNIILGNRTEVRSRYGDSHLGHVFNDGPAPTGLRYCINSAALRFIPLDQLKAKGYEEFIEYFKGKK